MGGGEVPRASLSLPSDRLTENAEALMPMINCHFIDAKVRQAEQAGSRTSFRLKSACNDKIDIS